MERERVEWAVESCRDVCKYACTYFLLILCRGFPVHKSLVTAFWSLALEKKRQWEINL